MKNITSPLLKKTLGFVAATALLLAGLSCTKKDFETFTTVGFNYSYDVVIPDTTIAGDQPAEGDYLSPLIDTKSAEKIKDAKTTADLVSDIKITRLTVTCLDGTSNLDYVKSIKIYIQSANNPEVLLMEKDSIPAGAYLVSMDLKDVNIKNFIFEDKIQFRTKLMFRPRAEIQNQKLRCDATLLGKATVRSSK